MALKMNEVDAVEVVDILRSFLFGLAVWTFTTITMFSTQSFSIDREHIISSTWPTCQTRFHQSFFYFFLEKK